MSATLRTSQHPNSAQAYRWSLALAVLLAVVSLVILPAYAHSGGPSAPSALRTVAGLAAPESLRGSQTAGAPRVSGEILPLERFSPSLLGIYRKVMEIEEEIRQHTDRLARAVCMYESGGNANLTSWAGAKGYFQVMPATFRSLRVETNIEAGIKYIGQMVDRFEREDYALAAYNSGPTNVGRGRAMRLESLQYVLGVGHFRTLLKLHEPSIRFHASRLRLTTVQDGEDWWALAERLQMPLLQLRLHNPYLARRQPRAGQLVAVPAAAREDLFVAEGDGLVYTTRLGDNYFNVAFTLDADLDEMRAQNELWHLQTLPVGMQLRIPLSWEGEHTVYRVQQGDTVGRVAETQSSDPWRLIRDNGLFWSQDLVDGMLLRVRTVPPKPQFLVHRVARGDNLTAIARRYGTNIGTIQSVNSMGRRTVIQVGEQLRIPTVAE